MLFFDELKRTIILDSRFTPLSSKYVYVLDLEEKDFFMRPFLIIEEIVAKVVCELEINGFRFMLPASWAVLIGDPDTSQIDATEIYRLSGKHFQLFTFGYNMSYPQLVDVKIINEHHNQRVIVPSLNRKQMLCHPISPDTWININPSVNSCVKLLNNSVIGDFF